MCPGIWSRCRSGVIGETRRTGGGRLSTAEELERLVALRDRGVLSEEEFQAEKARLLGHSSAEGPSEAPPPTEPLSRPSASSGDPTSPGFVASPSGPPVPPIPSPASGGGPCAKARGLHSQEQTCPDRSGDHCGDLGWSTGHRSLPGAARQRRTPARYSCSRGTPRARIPSPPVSVLTPRFPPRHRPP